MLPPALFPPPRWLCAPKGTGVLWARRDMHSCLQPAVVSHGYEAGLRPSFMWQGTKDLTGHLALPAVLRYGEGGGGGGVFPLGVAWHCRALQVSTSLDSAPPFSPPPSPLPACFALLGLAACVRYTTR